jgi:hypothetical protein
VLALGQGWEVNGPSQPLRECTETRNDSHEAWPCSPLLAADVDFSMETRVYAVADLEQNLSSHAPMWS